MQNLTIKEVSSISINFSKRKVIMHIYRKGSCSKKSDEIIFEKDTQKELERLLDNIFIQFVLGFYIIKDNYVMENLYRNLKNEILHVCIKQESDYCYKGIRNKAKLDKFIEKNSGYIYKKLFKQRELIN